jgi:hypothetical protein
VSDIRGAAAAERELPRFAVELFRKGTEDALLSTTRAIRLCASQHNT